MLFATTSTPAAPSVSALTARTARRLTSSPLANPAMVFKACTASTPPCSSRTTPSFTPTAATCTPARYVCSGCAPCSIQLMHGIIQSRFSVLPALPMSLLPLARPVSRPVSFRPRLLPPRLLPPLSPPSRARPLLLPPLRPPAMSPTMRICPSATSSKRVALHTHHDQCLAPEGCSRHLHHVLPRTYDDGHLYF